jgi:hypothetical protein
MTYTTVPFNQVRRLGQSQPPPLPKQPSLPALSPEEQAHFDKTLFEIMVKTALISGVVGIFLGVLVVGPIIDITAGE